MKTLFFAATMLWILKIVGVILLCWLGLSFIGSMIKQYEKACGKTYQIDRYINTNLFCESEGE
jgi:hypothetical protein